MLHQFFTRDPEVDFDSTMIGLPGAVTAADRGISAQARSMPDLDRVLDGLIRRGRLAGQDLRQGALLDLGCGLGGLAAHIGERLGLNGMIGVDLDPERLKAAAARGLLPLLLDLNDDPLPLESGSMRVVTCFGLLAYLTLYDNVLSEANRVLEDGGWLVVSIPNLGSYTNRLSLLLGYQPHAVAVSQHRLAGTIRRHREQPPSVNMPPLLHGATLRCMSELLDDYGFDTEVVRGFAPHPRRRPVIDGLASRIPSLSRRLLFLARKRPG